MVPVRGIKLLWRCHTAKLQNVANQVNDVCLDSWSLSHLRHVNHAPKYPFEPLLDEDFITDADNYLEDFINASDIPKKLNDSYSTTSTTTSATSGLKAALIATIRDRMEELKPTLAVTTA